MSTQYYITINLTDEKWYHDIIYWYPALLSLNIRITFKGELHLKPKLSMFCVLFQYYQHCFENDTSILKQIVWETQKWQAKQFLSYWSKHVKYRCTWNADVELLCTTDFAPYRGDYYYQVSQEEHQIKVLVNKPSVMMIQA